MKSICVSVIKEEVRRNVFENKKDALECFEKIYGEQIRTILEKKINKIRRNKEEMEKLKKLLQQKPTELEIKAETKCLTKEPLKKQMLLNIAGIYNCGNRLVLKEEKYYYIFEIMEAEDIHQATALISDEVRNGSTFLYITQYDAAETKARKEVLKIRTQVLREFHKDKSRLTA